MDEIAEILRLKDSGVLQKDIAAQVGVSTSTVSRVVAASRQRSDEHDEVREAIEVMLEDAKVPYLTKAILRGLARQFDALVQNGTPAAAREMPGVLEQIRETVTWTQETT